jgi:hypothetical protein
LCGRLIVVGNRYRSMIRLAADFNEIRTQWSLINRRAFWDRLVRFVPMEI